ncbi:MAG: V-type ATP synthase subunit D [Promethearchaeota archaeon]
MIKISFRKLQPTKTNLINLTKKLNFVMRGESFLEYKQEQLIQQIKVVWPEYKKAQKEFYEIYFDALIKLNETYREMGKWQINMINKISRIQFKPFIDILYRKNIGILLPYIDYRLIQERKLPPYSFENSSYHLDELIKILKDFFEAMIFYAEKEDILLKLLFNFKKINRRINGLKNVIKPQLQTETKIIKDILEELERENFVRLKKTKNIIKEEQLM